MILLQPNRLWSQQEVLGNPSPVSREPGVYAWYFKEIPPGVPVSGCHTKDGHRLLYIGISPREPPKNGAAPSRQKLFHRIRYHYRGNAAGSTLRLTLGCLLSDRLHIQLRRVGTGNRLTFADGECELSKWMGDNAFVVWFATPEPWRLERQLIGQYSLPLNLDMNNDHPFHKSLSQIRKVARENARALPIVG
jgi:hypothetical protein